ncbi:MAG TPA: recombinase family protein [Anaerolineaceae bacterium]|nr:recombinase family protein [Anaerolineaceae bacterium]HPN51176.1 recombinase family protein [Anaerolineaceae bacterium]
MENKYIRAAGYRRVSMREQVDGYSLDAQENHIRAYADQQGWQLVKIYTDAGISAKKDSQRPAFLQLMEDSKLGQFDVVIVDKIDRFFRHLNGLLTALDQLNHVQVSFASVQERLDFTSPWGKLTLTMLGMLAEIYIDNLRQETRKGKHQRARTGLSNSGVPPFGYCKGLCSQCTDPNGPGYCPEYGSQNRGDGKTMVAHPIESEAVRLAFQWYSSGDQSDRMITDRLNQTPYVCANGQVIPFRTKGRAGFNPPGPINRDLVREILNRQTYTGKVIYQGRDDNGRHIRAKTIEVYAGRHPSLISQDLFEEVQCIRKLLQSSALICHGAPARIYPLTGILRCGYCGGHMRGVSNKGRYYYQDASRVERTQKCCQPLVNAEKIESQVFAIIQAALNNPQIREEKAIREKQAQEAQARFERAKALFLAGYISQVELERERDFLETCQKALKENLPGAIMTLGVIGVSNADSLLKRKRLFQLTIETAFVRKNDLVGLTPTFPFLPLLPSVRENCTGGSDGI